MDVSVCLFVLMALLKSNYNINSARGDCRPQTELPGADGHAETDSGAGVHDDPSVINELFARPHKMAKQLKFSTVLKQLKRRLLAVISWMWFYAQKN